MEWIKVLEGAISSLLAATLLGFIARLYSGFRNIRLESILKYSVGPSAIGIGYNSESKEGRFDLQINNLSHVSVRVCQVMLQTRKNKSNIFLDPANDKKVYLNPLTDLMNTTGFFKMYLSKSIGKDEVVESFVTLPPKTMAIWKIKPDHLKQQDGMEIKNVFILFEYPTIFGNLALFKLKVDPKTLKAIVENVEKVHKCVKNDLILLLD